MKKPIIIIAILLIVIIAVISLRLYFVKQNKERILSQDIKQFELLERILNEKFGDNNEYNIILDNSFYYNFVTNNEYSNEVKEKINTLEKINMDAEQTYFLSLEYNNESTYLTLTNEIKEYNEKHVERYNLDVNGDKIVYNKDKNSYIEYEHKSR